MSIESILDSYVTLAEYSVLHLTPVGANVTICLTKNEVEELAYRVRPIPSGTVNMTAKEILLRCTGKSTVREIGKDLLSTVDETSHEDKVKLQMGILAFIQQALEYNVLESHKTSRELPIRLTGSETCFIPQHISFELVEHCNLKCYYCYKSADPIKKPYLSGKEIIRILENLSVKGLRSIELTGGEPTIHPDFYDILEFCAQKFVRVAILTNGTNLNNRITELMGKHKDTVVVQTDLDGSTPELHNKIRGAARAFERVVQGIKSLAAQEVSVRAAMNVTKENLYDIENTLILAKSLGATWFTFAPVLDYGRGKDIDTTYTTEELEYLETLKHDLKNKHGSFFNFMTAEQSQSVLGHNSKNCGAGYRAVVVSPTGKVRPCPILPEKYLAIGDLNKHSVEEVFSNPVVNHLHQLELPNSATCNNCSHEGYCRNCHARGIFTQASLKSPCNWISSNKLDQWVTFQSKETSNNELCKIANISCT